MILTCNSCQKKFVVPDQAITSTGRVVQCGSCGNKWKQFPIAEKIVKNTKENIKENIKKKPVTQKSYKTKKKRVKKTREISLYSPEYLEKKHGINLENIKPKEIVKSENKKISLGFYNSLLILIFFTIVISRGLYFFQDYIAYSFPITKFYLDYFFESIKNIFEIWKNLVSSY